MNGELVLRNRQRTRAVALPQLRRVAQSLLTALAPGARCELGVHLVGAAEMAAMNETFLQHTGSTDVITFDHREPGAAPARDLHGEIFICVDDAVAQARAFRTTWTAEVARYLAHGLLHLLGHDDHAPPARRRMKRAENAAVRELARRFPLSRLARKTKVRA